MRIPLHIRPSAAMGGTRVEPSRSLVVPADKFHYTPAVATDLASKFRAIAAEQKRAAAAAKLAEAKAAQKQLPLHGDAVLAAADDYNLPRALLRVVNQ